MPGPAAISHLLHDNDLEGLLLSLPEVTTLVRECLGIAISDVQIAAVFKAAHGDTVGQLQFTDFVEFLYADELSLKCIREAYTASTAIADTVRLGPEGIAKPIEDAISTQVPVAKAVPTVVATVSSTAVTAANVVPTAVATTLVVKPTVVSAANVTVIPRATAVASSTTVACGVPVAKATVVQIAKAAAVAVPVAKAVPISAVRSPPDQATTSHAGGRSTKPFFDFSFDAPRAEPSANQANPSVTCDRPTPITNGSQASGRTSAMQGSSFPALDRPDAKSHASESSCGTSALQSNLEEKGDNAYYYAHRRQFEVPADAIVRQGPGLVGGGAPELIKGSSKPTNAGSEQHISWIRDYSWADAGQKVKVYIPVPQDILEAGSADQVDVQFRQGSCELSVMSSPQRKFKLDRLFSDINPDKCSVRVEPRKARVVLVLSKQVDLAWPELLKCQEVRPPSAD